MRAFRETETGKQYHPRRRRAGWFSVIRAGGASLVSEGRSGSIRGRNTFEFVAEMLEVVLTEAQTEHFVDDRKEVSQRTNRT